jgi:hypothetical protein
MFGKSKKNKSQTAAPKGAAVNRADVGDGELILESLFVEERPESKTSKFEAMAEEADFIEVTPIAPEAQPVKAEPSTRATPKKTKEKSKGSGLLSGLFAKRPAQAKATAAPSAPSEPLDLNLGPVEEEDALELELQPEAKAEESSKESPSKPRKEKPKKAVKAPKPKKTKSSRRKGAEERYLVTQIGGDRQVAWRLTANGIESVEAVPHYGRAISFSTEDYRFETETRLTTRQAQSLVLQEIGDAVQILNHSKDLRAVYATLQSRLQDLSYRIGPGQLLVDRLIRERAPEAVALVIGLELKDVTGRDALLVLFYLSASGKLSEPQISIYPDNRDFLLSQFAATHQAARENAQVLLLNHEDLFAAAQSLAFYPNEPELAGIPVRKVWTHAAALSVLVAAACMAWAYQGFLHSEQAKRALVRTQNNVELVKRANTNVLSNSPRSLVKGMTLNVELILERARQLWVPGSRVQFVADGTGVDYRVTLPLMDKNNLRAPTVNATAASTLLHLPMPADCERGALNFSGTFNEAQLNIRCEAAPLPLDRYRDR